MLGTVRTEKKTTCKEKIMRFLKSIVRKLIVWSASNDGYQDTMEMQHIIVKDEIDTELESEQPINFKIFKAIGGKVVQTRCYDDKNDRITTTLYIIPDNSDFNEELAQIITREFLFK